MSLYKFMSRFKHKKPQITRAFLSLLSNLFGDSGINHTVAEREGFEPPVPMKVQLISNQSHSTTLTPLL